jgi:hypothetical protein
MERERAIRAGARLGALAMRLDRFDRPVAMRNLEIAFPALSVAERLSILRATYENWGRTLAEWMHFSSLGPDNIARFATYRGIENWRRGEELSRGRGGLILTGHFGNWELMILAHSIYGHRVAIVHRPLRNPLIDAAVCAARNRFGNRGIPRKGAGREVLRMLRQNWIVGMPLDLDVRKGVFVDFFSLDQRWTGAAGDSDRRAGGAGVCRARRRQQPPLHRLHGADRDCSRGRPRGVGAAQYAALHEDDRGDGAALSGPLELDPSALENPPARRAAFLLKARVSMNAAGW